MSEEVEQVLVFNEEVLLETLGNWCETGGLLAGKEAVQKVDEILYSGNLFYMSRPLAEESPQYKQVIPYCVIRRGNEIFRYERTGKGGEKRLHSKHSIGVGGHINPVDEEESFHTPYWNAFYRELNEETGLAGKFEADIVGLLYDPSDEVGKVHFGVVHILTVGFNTEFRFDDPALGNGRFEHVMDLKRSPDNFEKWSRLVIDNIL